MELDEDLTIEFMVEKCKDFTFADLRSIVNECRLKLAYCN